MLTGYDKSWLRNWVVYAHLCRFTSFTATWVQAGWSTSRLLCTNDRNSGKQLHLFQVLAVESKLLLHHLQAEMKLFDQWLYQTLGQRHISLVVTYGFNMKINHNYWWNRLPQELYTLTPMVKYRGMSSTRLLIKRRNYQNSVALIYERRYGQSDKLPDYVKRRLTQLPFVVELLLKHDTALWKHKTLLPFSNLACSIKSFREIDGISILSIYYTILNHKSL